jgi:hypothetical protein
MTQPKVQFRLGVLGRYLQARQDSGQSVSDVAQRDLKRYYALLALGLSSVHLNQGEAGLIVDALNGTLVELSTAQLLWAEIQDSLEDGLAEKWGVDGPTLVEKLRDYSLAQTLAIVDAVERFWGASHHIESTEARLVAVGLVKQG